jgi:hypothetical protein
MRRKRPMKRERQRNKKQFGVKVQTQSNDSE